MTFPHFCIELLAVVAVGLFFGNAVDEGSDHQGEHILFLCLPGSFEKIVLDGDFLDMDALRVIASFDMFLHFLLYLVPLPFDEVDILFLVFFVLFSFKLAFDGVQGLSCKIFKFVLYLSLNVVVVFLDLLVLVDFVVLLYHAVITIELH